MLRIILVQPKLKICKSEYNLHIFIMYKSIKNDSSSIYPIMSLKQIAVAMVTSSGE